MPDFSGLFATISHLFARSLIFSGADFVPVLLPGKNARLLLRGTPFPIMLLTYMRNTCKKYLTREGRA
jgi:hypothetical protein